MRKQRETEIFKSCYAIIGSASNLADNWTEALDKYKLFKTRVNEKTWRTKHQQVIFGALKALQKKKPPKNGEQLCELSLAKWRKGTQKEGICAWLSFHF